MGKTITFGENRLLTLKDRINEIMVGTTSVSHNLVSHDINEASAEVDEFELGQETNNPLVGGNYCHTVEETSVNDSKIPQEFIYRAKKLRPNEWSNWAVINLIDINIMPRYFEKRSVAYEYYKWLKIDKNNKPVIVNLDKLLNENKYKSKKNNKSTIVNESQIKNIIENLDFEVDSSDIDLSSFKKRSELAPIWLDDDTLDSRVRLRLLDIADDFWEFVNLTWVKPSGIILTGSICNFNWSKYSDIDLHLIVDFDEIDEKTDFVRDYLDAKKNEWNNEHSDLTILGFPVELYVQNLGEMPQSGGIYDLEENEWIKKPNMSDISPIGLDKFSIKDKAAEIMTIIDDMYNVLNATDDSHKIETIGDDAQYLWKKVKAMRKASLESNGESGAGNIVYKILRRTQYLDKLFRLFSVVYDRNNSITESVENNNNVDVFALAKERFGVTNDIRECGYILPDGSMLDFSGRHMVTGNTDTSHLRGRRGVDHREIGDLNWDADMTTKSGLNINMADFIRMGAIRIHCSNTWSSINLFKKPTREQVNPMLRLIQYSRGNVTVEIGDGDNSYEYAEWDEANPRRVVNDVIRYFDGETINLVGNVTESIKKFSNAITLLKEEWVGDGNSEHNPYKKRWDAERKALKDFVSNYGKLMQSKENGKLYKCYYDKVLSQLIGYNYCICIQWDSIEMKPKSVLYIRALDKFTPNIKQVNFDTRGKDNQMGTVDDNFSTVPQQTQYQYQ